MENNLHQIQTTLPRHFQRVKGSQDPQLVTAFINDADFAGANPLIGTNTGLGRTLVDDNPPKDGGVREYSTRNRSISPRQQRFLDPTGPLRR